MITIAPIYRRNGLKSLFRTFAIEAESPKPADSKFKWNDQLKDFSKTDRFKEALLLYVQMLRAGEQRPNAFTFPFVIKCSASLLLLSTGQQLHSQVQRTGNDHDTYVKTSLISLYSKCFFVEDARKVFDEVPLNPTVCYNAMIAGYCLNSRFLSSLGVFRQMRFFGVSFDAVTMVGLIPACTSPSQLGFGMSLHGCNVRCGLDNDIAVANALVTMYFKCGSVLLAGQLFKEMPEKVLISWNAMITGYAQNGMATQVLNLYRQMETQGVRPDAVTLLGVLSSCAYLGARSVGCEVEKKIEEYGFESNSYLKNALINMHARCGNLVKARLIFDEMGDKGLVSWTAIIGGYGLHGQGEVALDLFNQMTMCGIHPDGPVFVSVLTACSHAGLTDTGLAYFHSMETEYGLIREREHYSCTVDLLGRAGRLQEATELIESMPMNPDAAVWGALLGACKIHKKNVKLAELAFEQATKIEPTNIGYYVLLANVYTDAGDMEGVSRLRVMMRDQKLKKDPGYSYVDYKGNVHLFLAGDRLHPQSDEIYRMLKKLVDLINELDGVLKKFDDQDRRKKGREVSNDFGVHSERLAVAFAILITSPGEEIIVIKNLRVCEDCHWFIKSVSGVVDRKFVVRDATRFHHFEDGSCSCKDYW